MDKQRNVDTVPGGVSVKKEETKEIFLTTEQEITDFIEKAEAYGYSQMRIPAGTSFKGDYSSQVCVLKWHKEDFYVLLIPYDHLFNKRSQPTKKKKKKEEHQHETPLQTAIREAGEETKIKPINLIEVFRAEDSGKPESRELDKDKIGTVDYSKHLVHRFICLESEGQLVHFPDFKNLDDPETAQPVYVNIRHLTMLIERKRGPVMKKEQLLYHGHTDTVKIALAYAQKCFPFENTDQMFVLTNLPLLKVVYL